MSNSGENAYYYAHNRKFEAGPMTPFCPWPQVPADAKVISGLWLSFQGHCDEVPGS